MTDQEKQLLFRALSRILTRLRAPYPIEGDAELIEQLDYASGEPARPPLKQLYEPAFRD